MVRWNAKPKEKSLGYKERARPHPPQKNLTSKSLMCSTSSCHGRFYVDVILYILCFRMKPEPIFLRAQDGRRMAHAFTILILRNIECESFIDRKRWCEAVLRSTRSAIVPC